MKIGNPIKIPITSHGWGIHSDETVIFNIKIDDAFDHSLSIMIDDGLLDKIDTTPRSVDKKISSVYEIHYNLLRRSLFLAILRGFNT